MKKNLLYIKIVLTVIAIVLCVLSYQLYNLHTFLQQGTVDVNIANDPVPVEIQR